MSCPQGCFNYLINSNVETSIKRHNYLLEGIEYNAYLLIIIIIISVHHLNDRILTPVP